MGKVVEAVAIGVAIGALAFATGGFGLALTGNLLLGASIGIGSAAMSLSMTLMMKTPNASGYTSQSERKQVLRSSASPKTVVYGKTVSAGTLIFAEEQSGEQTDGEWVHLVIAVAGHKLHGIGTIWLGDNTIDTYGEYASHELINDAQTVNQFLLANCPSWKSDMIGKGVALLRVSLKFNADKYPSGIPNIKLEKQGREVYDPRDGLTKYSNNAALVILDYYRNYLNVADSELLWDYWKEAANISDEIVTNSDGTTEQRYTINGEFDLSETKTNVLDGMLLACAGDPVYIGGKHGLMVGAYYGPATLDLHDYQFSGDVSITPESSMTDRINSVTGKFVDPEQSYAETDFPAVTVDAWVEADGGEIKEDVTYRFVTSEWQAQRLANIKLRLKRYGRTIKVPMNMSGFAYRPGCYVNLYIKSLGIDGHTFRIRDWEFSAQNGITITLRDEPAEVYNGAIGSALIRSALTSLPVGGAAMPDNLQFVTEQIGDVVQGLLTWTNTGSIAVNNVIVRRDGATVLTAQAPGQSCRLSGLPAGQYAAEVRAVALTGAQSPAAAVSFTIATPPVPVAVNIEAANWSLELRPVFATANAFGTLCEFFFSTVNIPIANVAATATNLGMAAYLVHTGLQPDTEYYYWVRAVNSYGKSAFYPVTAKTDYDPSSILAVLDNQIGAEKLRAELRTEIEKIAVNNESIAQIEADVSSLEIRQSAAELAQSSLSSALASAQDDIQENAEKISVTSVDVTALKTAQSALTATAQSLSSSVNSITVDLSSLTTRQAQAEAILKSAQDLLGKTTIDVSLLHDQLSQQVQKYGADVQNLTDAILTVNPETGEITIDAVNVVKTELQSNINEVSQRVSSVEGVLTQKASTVDVSLQSQRISTVESQISSINAELTSQVTRAEFTETTDDVTQLTTRMSAAEGVISTKAAQQTVDAIGMRLSSAETALSVSNTTNQSQAQQISALQSDLTTDITDVKSQVSTVANSLSTQAQAIGSRIDDVIADYKAADSESNAAINEVSQALSSASSATAAQISNISTSVSALQSSVSQLSQSVTEGGETTASLYTQVNAINNSVSTIQGTISQLSEALATEKGTSVSIYQQLKAQADAVAIAASQAALDGDVLNRTYRNNAATVQSQIKAVVSSSESLAQTVDVLSANFESETAELLAKIATEQTARTTADESLADSITSLSASYKSADATLSASIQSESLARANEDSALSSRIDVLSASTAGNTAALQSESMARTSADSALSSKVDALSASTTADKANLSAQISSLSQTVTSNNESLSEQISDLDAKYGSETSGLSARITQNNTARVSAESALSSRVDSVESAYKTADSSINAKIASETTARSDADSALGTRIDQVSVSVNSNSAAITAESSARASADASISNRIDALSARTSNSESAIQAEQSARSSADSAMAQQIVDLSSSVKAGDDSLNAKITTLSQSTTTADQALSQRADNIEAAYKSADATQSAAISSLSSAVSDFESSTATQFSELNSSVDGLSGDVLVLQQTTATQSEITASVYEHLQAKTEVAAIAAATAALSDDESTRQRRYSEASIKHDVAVLTNDHEALAHTVEVLQADFETETANISAQITNEQTSRSTAIESLAQVISTIDATYKSADTANNARIATEETARAAADSALSTRVDQVIAKVNSNTAVIQSEQVARATADDALVQQINSVHALVDENVSSIQSEQTARVTADEALAHDIETLFSSVDGNSSAIQNEKIVRSSADAALSSRIDTVQATTNGLTASVNTVSQAQSSTDGELNALWATKAQVAGSVSGFGLEVTLNEDGSVLSSFVIDADVFAVLSRASGATSKIHPFVVKNGTVYIDHALIDSAEIDSLISTYISVTELNGKTIRGANLIGGTLAIGSGDNSCFMEGGSIGIGKGGPYGGWGYGWHTIIYNDGGIYTDRLHASSGDFTGYVHATSGYFENVTIAENCDVKGTIYANKIVGDVVAAKLLSNNTTYKVTSSTKTRMVSCTIKISNTVTYGEDYGTTCAFATATLYIDGKAVDAESVSKCVSHGGASGSVTVSEKVTLNGTVSANATHTLRVNGSNGRDILMLLFPETTGSVYL